MSNFPNQLDNDVTLPPVNDNITEIGGEAINALRDAVLNIEEEIGGGPTSADKASGTAGSIAARLNVSLDSTGAIKPSALIGLGLVTLPIFDSEIASTAAIKESKLDLDHNTQDLFNNILGLSGQVAVALGWINDTGIKVNPHVEGLGYRHQLSHIESNYDVNKYFKNRFDTHLPNFAAVNQTQYRNNDDAYTLFNDLNNDYVIHQKSDGYAYETIKDIVTVSGLNTYPSNFAHTAGGIYLDSMGYNIIPQNIDSLQKLADYIDSSSLLLLGSRIQNLYSNGISRSSRSNILSVDGYGPPVVPPTKVTTYLLSNGSSPNDSPLNGDDIIIFNPDSSVTSTNQFDAQFSGVKVGDVIRVNYGTVQTEFLVKEKKYIPGSPRAYGVRIDGKNLLATTDGYARIDRPLFNPNKYGALSVSAAQVLDSFGVNLLNGTPGYMPSLIVSHPRGAVALGNGFDPSQLNSTNYKLYLVLYPDGNPDNGSIAMAPIDITGNQGITPGAYTLESVVEATNNNFRKAGYNYRFAAFTYNGQFGIMLTDSYNNAGFSIIAGALGTSGYDKATSDSSYPNNIIQYDTVGAIVTDPLGFGFNKANIASPPYTSSYSSYQLAYGFPTKVYLPLKRNNYYVNGSEKDNFSPEIHQITDNYGDGYWIGTVFTKQILPSNVVLTYRVNHDLSTSSLQVGKTLVAQRLGDGYGNVIDYGRYVISAVNFVADSCNPDGYYTEITVYDSIMGNTTTNGISPPAVIPDDSAQDGYNYALYFNSDSVRFNNNNAFDNLIDNSSYKKYFEIYTDQAGKTFTSERARMNRSGGVISVLGVSLLSDTQLAKINIQSASPKLRGYTDNTVNFITLKIVNYDSSTGIFSGQLVRDGSDLNPGPLTTGKKGEVIRFYDETNIDYIDFIFDIADNTIGSFSNAYITIQLFPSLSQDEEIFLLASCQLDGLINIVSRIKDLRQFGNISEKDLSTSVFNYLAAPERLIHANGVVRGFDLIDFSYVSGNISLQGGTALVNGKFVNLNSSAITLPPIMENYSGLRPINWALCVNDNNELQLIPLLNNTDSLPLNRALNVQNIVSSNTYYLDAVTFLDLVNIRKDLTPLYNITATVTSGPSYSSVIVKNIRKFINNEPINNTLTWSNPSVSNIPSYLRSFESVLFWNDNYGGATNVYKIRGNVSVGILYLSNIKNSIIFEGDSDDATIDIQNYVTLPNSASVTFKNLTLNFTANNKYIANGGSQVKCIFENVKIKANDPTYSFQYIHFGDNCVLNDVSIENNCGYLSIGNYSDVNRFTVSGNCSSLSIGTNNNINYSYFGSASLGNININNYCIINFSSFPAITSGNLSIGDDCQITESIFGSLSNGSITINDKVNLISCTFSTISASGSNDAVTINNGASIYNCTFGNISVVNGKGIYLSSLANNTIIDNCAFADISVGITSTTNAIQIDGSYNTISNCSIGNITSATGGNTTTVYVSGSNFTLTNTTISGVTNNSSSSGVSALYFTSENAKIDRVTIVGTIASIYNAIMFQNNKNISVTNCNFGTLDAQNGIYMSGNCVFDNNIFTYKTKVTSVSGIGAINGGVLLAGDNITINNCDILNNGFSTSANPPPSISCYFNSSGVTRKNIYITNNKFTVTNNLDATVASIAFVQVGTTGTDPNIISNVFIKNNNSEELSCYIVSNRTGALVNLPGIMAHQTVVEENYFHLLGYSVLGLIAYKDRGLIIENNDINAVVFTGHDKSSVPVSNYGSGNVNIKNNRLSFLKTTMTNNSSGNQGYLLVESNIFESKSISTVFSFTDAINIVGVNAINSSCFIKNNTIKYGEIDYNNGISLNAGTPSTEMNWQIIGNSISGVSSVASGIYCVCKGNIPSIISNNTITRGSNDIATYISGYSGSTTDRYALVVDNVFDYDTVDGTGTSGTGTNTSDVIKNRGDNWVVERNVNQTETVYVTATTGNFGIDTNYASPSVNPIMIGKLTTNDYILSFNNTLVPSLSNRILEFSFSSTLGTNMAFVWKFNVKDVIPHNVTITNLQIDVERNSGTNTNAIFSLGALKLPNLSYTDLSTSPLTSSQTLQLSQTNFGSNLKNTNSSNISIILLLDAPASGASAVWYAYPLQITYKW